MSLESKNVLLLKNGSKLPNFSYKTEKRLISFSIKDDDILLIIKRVNVGKGHGLDQCCPNSQKSSIPLRIESSIISIDSNITDNIMRKVINV